MKTCAFYTLGCKVNQYETQGIREDFLKAGYEEQRFEDRCDVYIINTCTVTAKTDKESRRLVRDAYRRNPAAQIIVTGCYTELNESEIKNIPGVSAIVKNRDKDKIADVASSKKGLQARCKKQAFLPLTISDFKNRTKSFLKVQDGCNNFCSYCKVPLVRGRTRSRGMESTLEELKRLLTKGFKEIVLSGICLGAWGEDISPKRSFSYLLEKIIGLDGDFRIRLSSIEPKYVTSKLINLMKSSSKICKHLHIPIQSGDDKIIKVMNRPYTAAKYLRIVKQVKSKIPVIAITTDILVGFPGEGEKHFRNTCRLLKKIKPSRIHVFSYSRREGTTASKLEGEVPRDVVKKRLNRIEGLASDFSHRY